MLQVCNATPTNVISQYDYTYDASGRRVSCAKSGSAFTQDDTIAYGYNARSELTNATAAVDSDYRYAYDFDEIGNRETSSERGTNHTYAANSLNQYAMVGRVVPNAPQEEFITKYDDDGNQTLIKTSTGIWQVQYNGDNRPDEWSDGETTITMKFDRMGRRVEYIETACRDGVAITNVHHRFVYDNYLCLERLDASSNNAVDLIFAWDPSEAIATRPLKIEKTGNCMLLVTHEGNKNVSDLVFFSGGTSIAAHYEYAPFGAITASIRSSTSTDHDFRTYNPFRFSSEYSDDTLGLMYYNYRHYDPTSGRWLSRDPIDEYGGVMIYGFNYNCALKNDWLGLKMICFNKEEMKKSLESMAKLMIKLKAEEIDKYLAAGDRLAAARAAEELYRMIIQGGYIEGFGLASLLLTHWLNGDIPEDKEFELSSDVVKAIVSDDRQNQYADDLSVGAQLSKNLCNRLDGKRDKDIFKFGPEGYEINTSPYFYAIGGFRLEFSGNLAGKTENKETGCCEYKLDGLWTMTDKYDWHRGKNTPLFDKEGDDKSCVIIKDEWALIVKEELKKAKDFKVKGSWRGTRSIQCCGKK